MAELYKQNVSTYQGDCPCLLGKHGMFSNYIQEYAKGKTGHVLDVGAGLKDCESLDGCDSLQEVVDSFPEKYNKKFVYFLGKEEPLPFENESKDFVFCSCVIQHLNSHDELERGISQMARVLKKGGSFYLMYKAGAHDTILTHFNSYYQQERSFRVFSPDKVNQLLKKYGLEVKTQEKAMDDNWIPYVNVIAQKL